MRRSRHSWLASMPRPTTCAVVTRREPFSRIKSDFSAVAPIRRSHRAAKGATNHSSGSATWPRGNAVPPQPDRSGQPRSLKLSDDPNATRDAIRGASDRLIMATRAAVAREHMKRGVRPGDPNFAPLARQVRVAAEAVLRLAREEEVKADATSGRSAGAGLPTINESRPRSDLACILDEWRVVEHRLETAEPALPKAQRLLDGFETLRDRHAEALKAFQRRDQGSPRSSSPTPYLSGRRSPHFYGSRARQCLGQPGGHQQRISSPARVATRWSPRRSRPSSRQRGRPPAPAAGRTLTR